jgi:hypothetical protein
MDSNDKWYKLDTAAKIYPALRSRKESCVFRLFANLADEINPDLLAEAASSLKPSAHFLN